jgi:UDP-N-acetylmuramoyl-tripeptide--D-alanyl-D-alanine ligase
MGAAAAIELTAPWVADAMAGIVVSGDPARRFSGVSIDSRTIAAGDLFVAIRGERFDGADFAPAAISAGAGGVVVPRGRGRGFGGPAPSAPTIIEVGETTSALQALATRVRHASGTKVVAITGSAGKTTTKEIAAEFLSTQYRVVRNRGNLNNHIGLPLSLVELRYRPEIAVVELGMNHAGEVSTLVRIAAPDVRVWTNVGEAHLGFFASLDAIADAKAEIFEGAMPRTVLVANADDDRIAARLPRFGGRVVTFGLDHEADVRASVVADHGIQGTTARVRTRRTSVEMTIPLVGRGNLANVLAAAAVALEFDVPLETIAERAARLRPLPHRGRVVRLAQQVTLIDDSYNANPTATRCALELLGAERGASRRVAVLGEMIELGHRAEALHEEIGRAAVRAGVDVLWTIGGAPAEALGAAAVAAGLPLERVRHFDTSEQAAGAVAALVRPGDLFLVKGSHAVRTDRVVERLEAEFA